MSRQGCHAGLAATSGSELDLYTARCRAHHAHRVSSLMHPSGSTSGPTAIQYRGGGFAWRADWLPASCSAFRLVTAAVDGLPEGS
jgi:hypothetical protein